MLSSEGLPWRVHQSSPQTTHRPRIGRTRSRTSFHARAQWSEQEYLILTDHRNRLVEFTDGFLEVLPMPTDKHQAILGFLYLAFFHFIDR